MNILMVTYWHFPNIGAIDIYLRKIREELTKAGHKVDIISRGASWSQIKCHKVHATARVVNLTKLYSTVGTALRGSVSQEAKTPQWIKDREVEQYLFELGLHRLFVPGRYDMVHAHDVHSARAVARVAPGIPLVLTTHGLLAYEWLSEKRISGGDSAEWRYTYIREKTGVNSAHVAISPSDWMRQEYIDYFRVPAEKVATVPYGFDVDKFAAQQRKVPKDLPDLKGSLVLTCVARLVPLKGHRYLFRALREVRDAGLKVKCLLVGDGYHSDILRKLVKVMGLEKNVFFLGRRDDVPSILRITDIFVLPSLQEITPLAISEAQLAGKAVIASAVGGIPELVTHGVNGILVPAKDHHALAEAITTLCNNEDLRLRMGVAGRVAVLRDRTWSQHYDRLMKVYKQARSRASHKS